MFSLESRQERVGRAAGAARGGWKALRAVQGIVLLPTPENRLSVPAVFNAVATK